MLQRSGPKWSAEILVNFSSLRVIELSCKIWILLSMGNFMSHFRGHLGPADLVKVPEILVSYFIFGMFLL